VKNLFIIGAQRSGSTLLAKTLDLHSKIKLMTPIKPEPKYFLGSNYLGKQTYLDFFKIYGKSFNYFLEKSVSYIEHEDALKRINFDFPDAKILIIFREPVSRCWSNYKYSRENGIEKREFSEAIENFNGLDFDPTISVNPFAYIERGFYDKYLEKVLNIFPKRNIKVIIFEEFISSPESLNDIFEWLNLKKIRLTSNIFNNKINNTNSQHLDPESIDELSHLYIESIRGLENLLGSKIDLWRNLWKERGIRL
jgi:hypothetical protein